MLQAADELRQAIASGSERKIITGILKKLNSLSESEGGEPEIVSEIKATVVNFISSNEFKTEVKDVLANPTSDLQTMSRAGVQRWLKRFRGRLETAGGEKERPDSRHFKLPEYLRPLIHQIDGLIDTYLPSTYKGE